MSALPLPGGQGQRAARARAEGHTPPPYTALGSLMSAHSGHTQTHHLTLEAQALVASRGSRFPSVLKQIRQHWPLAILFTTGD